MSKSVIPKNWYDHNSQWFKDQCALAERRRGLPMVEFGSSRSRLIADLPNESRDISDLAFGFYVYFLIEGSRVVYIGQSTNLMARIGAHRKRFRFDCVRVVEVKYRDELDARERHFIEMFNPPYNKVHTINSRD